MFPDLDLIIGGFLLFFFFMALWLLLKFLERKD